MLSTFQKSSGVSGAQTPPTAPTTSATPSRTSESALVCMSWYRTETSVSGVTARTTKPGSAPQCLQIIVRLMRAVKLKGIRPNTLNALLNPGMKKTTAMKGMTPTSSWTISCNHSLLKRIGCLHSNSEKKPPVSRASGSDASTRPITAARASPSPLAYEERQIELFAPIAAHFLPSSGMMPAPVAAPEEPEEGAEVEEADADAEGS
mmetsp:Transcript_90167/g.227005  ORF Transcript_90167/g.227005 Transcript_90167/m.227005 type:complete len:206 (-) Transcript_90167:175-792(-)